MFTPSGSPPPTPPDRDKDEWLAIVVALGVLGSAAGWILVGGFPQVNLRASDPERPTLEGTFPAPPEDGLPETPAAPGDAANDGRLQGSETGAEGSDRPPTARATSRPGLPSLIPNTTGQTTPHGNVGRGEGSSEDPPTVIVVPQPAQPENSDPGEAIALQPPLIFSDLPDTHWAKPSVDGLTARGKLAGFPDGSYQPDKPMTRAELAAQLNQTFTRPPQQPTQTFSDIPVGYWAMESINKAVETGFMKGYPGGIFSPDQTVPRVQVIAAIAAGLTLNSTQLPDTVLAEYADQGSIPPWARDAVAAAVEVGLVGDASSQSTLRPNDLATRAEVAALLYEALVYMGEAEPL